VQPHEEHSRKTPASNPETTCDKRLKCLQISWHSLATRMPQVILR